MADRPGAVRCGWVQADIGTHAFNLATFVPGLLPKALLADLAAFGPGRSLDNNAANLLRFCDRAGPGSETPVPDVLDGLAGIRFLAAGLRSQDGGGVWIDL